MCQELREIFLFFVAMNLQHLPADKVVSLKPPSVKGVAQPFALSFRLTFSGDTDKRDCLDP